jgi:hypothetical protein
MRCGTAAGLSCFVWLAACWGGCSADRSDNAPGSMLPRPGGAILVAPDGLGAQGAPCAREAECHSGVCWRGFCAESAPATNGGGPGVTGGTCAQDADCKSGFCDLGQCAELFGPLHYGFECSPEPPRAPPGRCGPYLCLEGRCRSCQSDAQCQELRGAPTCAVFEDRPGKQCGRLVEGFPPATPAAAPTSSPGPPKP